MPHGIDAVPKHPESRELAETGPNLDVRIRTRIRRSRLDSQLAHGADSTASAERALRAAQLQSTAERARIANALVEMLGDARRGEPMTLRPRPQRAAVREAADDVLALVLRLRDARPAAVRGAAMAARLVDDRTSPMHRHDTGDLREAIRAAASALDATRDLADGPRSQAA
jgi:hypothetical protein